ALRRYWLHCTIGERAAPIACPAAARKSATWRPRGVLVCGLAPGRIRGLMTMSKCIVRSAALMVLVSAFWLAAPAPAKAQRFDGNWSVLIITQSGDCDRAYRYGVRIQGGQ